MNKRAIAIASTFWLFFTSLLNYPSHAFAVAIGDRIKCEELPNKYWTPLLAKRYTQAWAEHKYGWKRSEYKALVKLWTAESNWRAEAFNKSAGNSEGDHAGGIPQILGLDPRTPAPLQIERGLVYIKERYGKPSIAYAHHRNYGWY